MASTSAKAVPLSRIHDLEDWVAALTQPSALMELASLLLCIGLAWTLGWLLRRSLGASDKRSIWFGQRLVDGVLFPLLLLCLAFAARALVARWLPLAVFQIAVPVLVSLLVIRVGVKVLQAAFTETPLVRLLEHTISWLAWGAVVLWVSGLLLALSAVGVDLTALSVLGGAIGVGVGFGLQKLAANYVSGFVILAERSMRIGDNVKVDGFEGCITQINARYTVVRSVAGRESIVPNEMLITSRVENLSLADTNVLQTTQVSVAYDSDVDLVIRLLLEAVLNQPRVLREPEPAVALSNFGADGLEFQIGYWIADPENGAGGLKSLINVGILKALRAHQIEIPYPQRVLHTKVASPTS